MRLFWITCALTLLADQASKLSIIHLLELPARRVVEVLPPLLTFRWGENTGINFGLFGGGGEASRWIMIALALAISAFVFRWVREGRTPVMQVAGGLLIGGALGNVIDRLAYGYVADFLNMSCCGLRNPYVFNVADIGIFAGAIGLALFSGGGSRTDA